MAFSFKRLEIPDVVAVESDIFKDERGFLTETFKRSEFAKNNIATDFVQDNFVRSAKGVLRGLHYQLPPHTQGKLVRVTRGKALDVAVDLRRDSPWFGRWVGAELTADNGCALWVPPGFAHGFIALEDDTDVYYKMTGGEYSLESARIIIWNDPTLNIDWKIKDPLLLPKDLAAPRFDKDGAYFEYNAS
ncbi:MAG: dTDP-4-dehydrorhamnose 3,5-epimerase [Candidatus Berkelbacteria bacterium]|nr:MAG: dTDP-4-dehydrorhamnose 3,5-epimerase [Candidatus Berkelbacteria bacterium]QQG51698.1 MAG: dTDP-4-dehydrorhamnose 3,5-epimerase [Candidatus Berkelbacteria bacterium]